MDEFERRMAIYHVVRRNETFVSKTFFYEIWTLIHVQKRLINTN